MSDHDQSPAIAELQRELAELKKGQELGRRSNIWVTSGSAATIMVAILSGLIYLVSWQGQTAQRLMDHDRMFHDQGEQIQANTAQIGTMANEIRQSEVRRAENQQAILDAIQKLQRQQ